MDVLHVASEAARRTFGGSNRVNLPHLSRPMIDFFIASANVNQRFEKIFGIPPDMFDYGKYVNQVCKTSSLVSTLIQHGMYRDVLR